MSLLGQTPAPDASQARRGKARELLDSAVELAGAASLEVHAMALAHIAGGYREFDPQIHRLVAPGLRRHSGAAA